MTIEEIDKKLSAALKPQRYIHSIGVANTAAELAGLYGADEKKAYLAGLVHDCAKNLSAEQLFERLLEYKIEIDEIAKKSYGLIHGFVGAELAKREYGILDSEIYDAIYYHTIGKAAMPLLTKIIYLADGIEPGRDYPCVAEIRAAAGTNLDKAVLMYTDMTIKYVIERGALLHPFATEVRNYYLLQTRETGE